MKKVLWLSPNFNHYKARFLNRLAMDESINLSVLSGAGRLGFGDKELNAEWEFNYHRIDISKKNFGFSLKVLKVIRELFVDFDWVLLPVEKKNILVFIYCLFLRFRFKLKGKNVKLISYNHPTLKSGNGRITLLDRWLTRFHFNRLDRIIFYTKDSCLWAINNKLLKSEKAFWANNTIDDDEVNKFAKKRNSTLRPPSLLLIGRLLEYRWIDRLIRYYEKLLLEFSALELHIIGDGPESFKIERLKSSHNNVFYYGSLIREEEISLVMAKVDYVFVPGHSGLSINHAFAYEKPYITSKDYNNHPPEYSYLKHRINCILLTGKEDEDLPLLIDYLSNKENYRRLIEGVVDSKSSISIKNWIVKIKEALLDD